MSPPLIVTAEQADCALDVLEECIALVESGKVKGKPSGSGVEAGAS
jgi:hypothetical protein